jgi:thiopeptide-type bacteriocin biosynthesis protein
VAAGFADIAAAFTGGVESGSRWLVEHFMRTDDGAAPPRPVLEAALSWSCPRSGAAALRALPGGEDVVTTWEHRGEALNIYRAALVDADIEPGQVLASLLHMHHNRAAAIDPQGEAACRRLARNVALSWTARRKVPS